jgi:hypothetical protein
MNVIYLILAHALVMLSELEIFNTRQAVHVQRNVVARSRNICCRGKPISITYFCECARV